MTSQAVAYSIADAKPDIKSERQAISKLLGILLNNRT